MKLIFYLQMNIKVFDKQTISLWLCIARDDQSTHSSNWILGVCDQTFPITPNNNFAISLQYLKKKVSAKVDFLHADKHERLLQIDTKILMEMLNHSQSLQSSKFAMFL